jgi:lysophospholipase L1-like esterase
LLASRDTYDTLPHATDTAWRKSKTEFPISLAISERVVVARVLFGHFSRLEADMATLRPIPMLILMTILSVLVAAPARAQTWVSTWSCRGPLSTTITTATTTTDSAPNLSDRTLRVMAHATAGGSKVRVRLSQRYSTFPLVVDAARLAIATGTRSGIFTDAARDQQLTFGGAATVTVPAGGDVWSDAITMTVARGAELAITFHVPAVSGGSLIPTTEGGHGYLRTSYLAAGNQADAASFPSDSLSSNQTKQAFIATEVQVLASGKAATLVTLGDSITEGATTTLNGNKDWPDVFASLNPSLADGTSLAVFNAGIGSGRFVTSDGAGLRGLTRLGEWVAKPDVRWVTVLMGVNDISYEHADAATLEKACQEAIRQTHAAGKKIIGIPILPFGGSVKDDTPNHNNMAVAQAVNTWIRAHDKRNGVAEPSYDAVIDLEPTMIDKTDLSAWRLNPSLSASDQVHPNDAGHDAIARAIPLSVLN